MKTEMNVSDILSRRPPLRAVPPRVNAEVVTVLRNLLDQAEAGALHGLVFAAMCSDRLVVSDIVGEPERSLIFARGLAAVIDDTVREAMRRPAC